MMGVNIPRACLDEAAASFEIGFSRSVFEAEPVHPGDVLANRPVPCISLAQLTDKNGS